MHTILLCGGSGQRLWPLSGRIRSKMYLELLPAPGGGKESMIGRVSRQLEQTGLGETALFVTHRDQLALTRRYTRDRYPVIGEPEKRGTFTAAALGALYLYSSGKAKPEDILCVAPADMFADDGFFRLFHQFTDILSSSQADLALLGTRPAYPSDQYGYIVPGKGGPEAYAPVVAFEEKPDIARAQQLLKDQALWNCGVFAFPLSMMLAKLEQMGLPLEPAPLIDQYPGLPVRSFDKEVAERCHRAVVLPHEGEWRDLGSWSTLSSELSEPVTGAGGIWGASRDSHIVNQLDIPLHVIGVPGIIAVGSPEGILVADKGEANAIKDIQQAGSDMTRYGESDWGSYTVIDRTVSGTQVVVTMKLSLLPGQRFTESPSLPARKSWIILSGQGEYLREGTAEAARTGDIFTMARGELHGLKAYTALSLLEIRICDHEDELRLPT
ncbi:sugar phosphate nucleotidyltransferase [Paenibacillus sp. NFR01]|uniref:sugar phosphate nucleotidyltransferase n=1 Tax=Paenibacillus sp. NFR01 TaxID=1566279 RepID=UPI0008B2CFF5|nr:sugar phosphate nucleotidyltransferase [Paenibacillus sp. NFR01]SET89148.1 mannose-1-phosphate guanylyltransferase [Paenibacillus sp. NFR01]